MKPLNFVPVLCRRTQLNGLPSALAGKFIDDLVDFPAWVVDALDREARLRGVPQQSLIKLWIAERLKDTA